MGNATSDQDVAGIRAGNPRSTSWKVFARLTILSGPIALGLFFILMPASSMLPPPSPSKSAEWIVNHYTKNEDGIKAGVPFMLAAGAMWPIFAAGISGQLARIPRISPTLLWAQVASGTLAAVTMMLPGIFFGVTAFRLDRAPELTQLLSDLSWLSVTMPFPPFIAQDLLVSCAILSDKRPTPLIPHWVAWVNSAVTLTFYPAFGVHCVRSGPIAWNGAVTFWLGAVGLGLQIGLLVLYFLKSVNKMDDDLTVEPICNETT